MNVCFRHIVNCDYLVGSKEQKTNRIRDTSSYNISAQKFLTFIPLNSIFHLSNETKSSFEDDGFEHIDNYDCVSQFSNGSEIINEPKFIIINYLDYLNDAHTAISNCIKATKSWNNKYDSINVITDHTENGIPNNYSANNSHVPNGYNENQNNSSIGPFLSNLLNRLEMMCDNDFYINLHLTGLISRLACYPQPLIRSFLLNSKMTFNHEVKSLWTILTNLRNKFDNSAVQVTNFEIVLNRAKRFLKARDEKLLQGKNGFSHNMMDHSNFRKGSITSITSEIDSSNKSSITE